jgi:hypothetical protein
MKGETVMNNHVRNIVIIIVILVTAIIAYSVGMYAKNAVVMVSNAEVENSAEVSDEIPIENSEENSEIENEIPISDADLTDEAKDVIIITENEAVETEPTVEDIIMNECGLAVIDYIALVDSYEDGRWYCYYICADGDCYAITLKNNHVDVCCQLN